MAEKIYVTRGQLEAIAAGLGKLKKKEDERFLLKAAVGQLSSTITETLAKGYSYPDIAQILERDHNIAIKPATLSTYHRNAIGPSGRTSDTENAVITTAVATADAPTNSSNGTLPLGGGSGNEGKFIEDPSL